ncbi:hypothetical protein BHE74_00058489, partial [Ensete ventricosum]
CPSPTSPSLRRRRRCPYVGDDCPLRPAIALTRGDHPCDRRCRPYWRQGWPRAATPCGLAAAGWPLRAGRNRPCPRVTAPCGLLPLRAVVPCRGPSRGQPPLHAGSMHEASPAGNAYFRWQSLQQARRTVRRDSISSHAV